MSKCAGSVIETWEREDSFNSRDVEDLKHMVECMRIELLSLGDEKKTRKNITPRERYDAVANSLFDALLTVYENLVRWFWPGRLSSWARFSLVRSKDAAGVCGCSMDEDGIPRISLNAGRLESVSRMEGVVLRMIIVLLLRATFHAVMLKDGKNDSTGEWESREAIRFGFNGQPMEWDVFEDSPANLAYQIFVKRKVGKSLRFDRLIKAYEACSSEDREMIDLFSDVSMSLDSAIAHGADIQTGIKR